MMTHRIMVGIVFICIGWGIGVILMPYLTVHHGVIMKTIKRR